MDMEDLSAGLVHDVLTYNYFGDYSYLLENIEDFIEREMS